jgi:integrase/recombinase XerD
METITKYVNEQKAKGSASETVKLYNSVLKRLNKFKPLDKITKDDLVRYFAEWEGADSTRMTHTIVIKKFFKDIKKPDVADWLKAKKPKEILKFDDVLDGEDVNKMIAATDSLYWKAMIAILYDTGARIKEIRSLKYRDFKDTQDGLIVHIPTTKTAAGFRKMILINSAQYIRNLQASINGKPDDVVFKFKYRYTFEVIRDIGRAAGIKKHVHPHGFRHAAATKYVHEMPEMVLRKMMGWTPNSAMVSRYVSLSDESVIETQLGKENHKEQVKLNPAEKIDLEPVYDSLKEENKQLKSRLEDETKNLKEENKHLWGELDAIQTLLEELAPNLKYRIKK